MRHHVISKSLHQSSLWRIVALGCGFGLLFGLTISRSSPETGQVRLMWDPPTSYVDGSPILDLASVLGGYRVYYWQDDWDDTEHVDVGNQPTAMLTQLEVGRIYNFAVSVYDFMGRESDLSEVVSATIPESSLASGDASGGGGCAIAMSKRSLLTQN